MNRSTLTAAGLALVSALIVIVLVLASSPGGTPLAPATIATPTPRPIPPTPEPAATVAALDPRPTLRLPTMAYAAPDGDPLGGLEAGRPYIAVARWGIEWTQIDAEGAGRVWVRDELQPGAPLPDLRPTATPRPAPPVARQPFTCERTGALGTFTGRSWISIDDACLQADRQFGAVVVPVTMTPWGGQP